MKYSLPAPNRSLLNERDRWGLNRASKHMASKGKEGH